MTKRITAKEIDKEFEKWWIDFNPMQWSGLEACTGLEADLARYIFAEAWIRAQAWAERQKKEEQCLR